MRTVIVSMVLMLVATNSCTTGATSATRSPGTEETPTAHVTPATKPSTPASTAATPVATPATSTPTPATFPATTPAPPCASANPCASSSAPSSSPEAETPAPIACLTSQERNAFVAALLDDLRSRDQGAIAARMADPFQYMMEATDVFLDPVAPSVAVTHLFAGVPDPDGNRWFLPLATGATVTCVQEVRLADLNADPSFWPGWDVGALSTGWGEDGMREAIIVLGHTADGSPVWHGLFYTMTEFDLQGPG